MLVCGGNPWFEFGPGRSIDDGVRGLNSVLVEGSRRRRVAVSISVLIDRSMTGVRDSWPFLVDSFDCDEATAGFDQ